MSVLVGQREAHACMCAQESCAKEYQRLDEDRIDFTRKLMWLHANLLSITYAHNDQVAYLGLC